MNRHDTSSPTPPSIDEGQPKSAAQRRALLRALGASGAIAGAGLPMGAQATGGRKYCVKTTKNYHATASAVGSMMGSQTGSTPPVCGHKTSHYCSSGNWGSGWTNGNLCTLTYSKCCDQYGSTKLRFYEVMNEAAPTSSTSPKNRYCWEIMRNDPGCDEAVWLTAVFNACKKGSAFSYTPAQVCKLYKSKNPLTGDNVVAGLDQKALQLFREYLSNDA
jgi:hypothetical protein